MKYIVFGTLIQQRAYEVEAESAAEAEMIVREDHELIHGDLIDSEITDVSVED